MFDFLLADLVSQKCDGLVDGLDHRVDDCFLFGDLINDSLLLLRDEYHSRVQFSPAALGEAEAPLHAFVYFLFVGKVWWRVEEFQLARDAGLHDEDKLGAGHVVLGVEVKISRIARQHSPEALQFVESGGDVKVVVGHRWLYELSVVQGIEHGYFDQGPVARVRIELIDAFPNLEFFIEQPDCVVQFIIRYSVGDIDDGLVLF